VLEDRRGDDRRRMPLANESIDERQPGPEGVAAERLPEPVDEPLRPAGLDRRRRGHPLPPDPGLEHPLDELELVGRGPRHERDRESLAAGPAGAADAVDIVLGVVGHVVVDHEAQVVHVDAAGGHVGGHEEGERPLLEAVHDPRALGLRHPAVQAFRGASAGGEGVGEFLHHVLRVAEDHAAGNVVIVEQPREGLELGAMWHLVGDLLDGRGAGGRPGAHAHRLGIAGVAGDESADLGRERRREEHRLPLGRCGGEDLLDVFPKAHVEHPVGLVEHHHPDGGEGERAPGEVIDEPAGRAHEDVHAATELRELRLVGRAAVDGERADAAGGPRELPHLAGHLRGEFSGGHEDQDLRGAAGRVDPLDGRDAEGRRLARARLRLPDHVAARHDRRNRRRLHGRGGLEPHPADRLEHGGREAEGGEGDTAVRGGGVGGGFRIGSGGHGPVSLQEGSGGGVEGSTVSGPPCIGSRRLLTTISTLGPRRDERNAAGRLIPGN